MQWPDVDDRGAVRRVPQAGFEVEVQCRRQVEAIELVQQTKWANAGGGRKDDER